MSYADKLKAALDRELPSSKLHYLDGWKRAWYRDSWAAGKPVALMLHHTAGAATSSTDPAHPGNSHGANQGQVNYVNRHPSYGMPASAFTLDRDGCLYVNAALPCYHAGAGSFQGTQWDKLGCPTDSFNSYGMGVECVSKGQKADFTTAMKMTLAQLAGALADVNGWANTGTLYLPRHKDWAPDRKVDIKHSNSAVQDWMVTYGQGFWDGITPTFEGCMNAWNDLTLANPQAWRIACRLADWGFYRGAPQAKGVQAYPIKAVQAYQEAKGYDVPVPGQYGEKLHQQLWPSD